MLSREIRIYPPLEDVEYQLQKRRKEDTAEVTATLNQLVALTIIAVAILWLLTIGEAIVVVGIMIVIYLAIVAYKTWVTAHATQSTVTFASEELADLKRAELSVYTILVPLYREAEVLPALVRNLMRLDYPVEKLDIKLLLEADDEETIDVARSLALPDCFELVIIEPFNPRTKPKACNVGLELAKGEFLVVYDAEDRPETDQLLKAVSAFGKLPKDVVCIQAKLEYYNPNTNILTGFFAGEYATYFDLVLPGLVRLGLPVPLGGTSNHFRTRILQEVGGWDAHNVTEDIDLGMRLARYGWRITMMDSVTWEEANSRIGNWVRQRSRWIKGHIQTWLVHMRHPIRLWRELGTVNFLSFQLVVGATPLILLVNPIFVVTTPVYLVAKYLGVESIVLSIERLYPAPLLYLGTLTLLSNFLFVYYVLTGCMVRELWSNVRLMYLAPLYWQLISIAAWKALWQMLVRPSYWEKTVHGLVQEPEEQKEELGVAQQSDPVSGVGNSASGLSIDSTGRDD